MSFSKVDKGYRRKEVVVSPEGQVLPVKEEYLLGSPKKSAPSSSVLAVGPHQPVQHFLQFRSSAAAIPPLESIVPPSSLFHAHSTHHPLFFPHAHVPYWPALPANLNLHGHGPHAASRQPMLDHRLPPPRPAIDLKRNFTLEEVRRTRPELLLTPVEKDDENVERKLLPVRIPEAIPMRLPMGLPMPLRMPLPMPMHVPPPRSANVSLSPAASLSSGSLVIKMDEERRIVDICSPHSSVSSSSLSSSSSSPSSLAGLSNVSSSMSPQSSMHADRDPASRATRKRRRQDSLLPQNCPFTVEQVVEKPIDEFNQLLHEHQLDDEAQHQYKELRRKGKNRVAAFKSRQNRLNRIRYLMDEKQEIKETINRLSRSVDVSTKKLQELCSLKYPEDLQRLKIKFSTLFAKQGISIDEVLMTALR